MFAIPSLQRRGLRICSALLLALVAAGVQAGNYVKVSNSGAFLPASTTTLGTGPNDWACTYDRDTNLLWEVKTSDGGTRDWNRRYTNYDLTYDGGNPANIDADGNSMGFVKAVNDQGLCGFTDWKRPNIGQLTGLVLIVPNAQFGVPMIDGGYFPNTWHWLYTSSSPESGTVGNALGIGFADGRQYRLPRSNSYYLRLVREGLLYGVSILTAGTGAGSVTGGAANCTRSAAGVTEGNCLVDRNPGLPNTFTAIPAPGSVFSGWSGCDSTTHDIPPRCTLTASTNRTVTATFARAGAADATGGAVTAVPALHEGALMLLGLAAAALGARNLRRHRLGP